MRISNVTIEKFRSIHQMDFAASPLTAICGPNSCGKSNVLRAIKFAFLPSYNAGRMVDNICYDVVGGNAACQVKLTFDSPTPALAASLGVLAGQPFTYSVIASLQAAATTIRAELRNLPTKASKATKIVDSMLTELANPPAAGSGFTGSILDGLIRKHTLLNAAEIAALAAAIGRRQPRKTAQLLSPKNIWLWSGAIEEVILRSPDAENDAEVVLRSRGALHQAFPGLPERRVAMTNLLHNSAHEPELVRDVVETLWRAGRFDHSEVKSAIRFILG